MKSVITTSLVVATLSILSQGKDRALATHTGDTRMQRQITKFVVVDALPSKVYAALTTEAGFRSWWTKGASVRTGLGSEAAFAFNGGEHVMSFRFTALEPNRLVALDNTGNKNNPDWNGTQLSFKLSASPSGQTKIELIHSGWATDAKSFDVCNDVWSHFLQSLKAYLETGAGTPVANKANELQDPAEL